jgi:hypothetical protein
VDEQVARARRVGRAPRRVVVERLLLLSLIRLGLDVDQALNQVEVAE